VCVELGCGVLVIVGGVGVFVGLAVSVAAIRVDTLLISSTLVASRSGVSVGVDVFVCDGTLVGGVFVLVVVGDGVLVAVNVGSVVGAIELYMLPIRSASS